MTIDTNHPNWVKVETATLPEINEIIRELEYAVETIKVQLENAKFDEMTPDTIQWTKDTRWARAYKIRNLKEAIARRAELKEMERLEREQSEDRRFIRLMKERYPTQSREIWAEVRSMVDDDFFFPTQESL